MKFVVCFLGVFIALYGVSQKNTQAKGTLFVSLGTNTANYFPSSLHFPTKQVVTVKGFDGQLLHQWNAKVGYYFRNHYALSLRVDQQYFNYINQSNFYNNFVTSSLEISGTEKLLSTKDKKIALSGIVAASIGAVWNRTIRTELLSSQQTNWSCSGLNFTPMVALRAEFYKRFFVQLEERMQLFYQKDQSNSKNFDENTTHFLGATQTALTLGFFMYRKFYDDCNTCPKW